MHMALDSTVFKDVLTSSVDLLQAGTNSLSKGS